MKLLRQKDLQIQLGVESVDTQEGALLSTVTMPSFVKL